MGCDALNQILLVTDGWFDEWGGFVLEEQFLDLHPGPLFIGQHFDSLILTADHVEVVDDHTYEQVEDEEVAHHDPEHKVWLGHKSVRVLDGDMHRECHRI